MTDNNLSSELEADAAEEGWLRLQPSSEVPAVLGLDANSVAWAKANGPGSVLGNYLYDQAKLLGEDVAPPPSQKKAAVTKAAAAYATGRALDLGAQVAKQLAAQADPMAAAVVAGLAYFIASFTGWDELRAGFYQAVEQAGAESAFVDAARALERRPQRRDRQPGTLPAGWRICLVGLQLLRREHLAGQRGERRPGSFSGHLT